MRYAARQGDESRSPTRGVRLRCYRPDVSSRSPTLIAAGRRTGTWWGPPRTPRAP